MTVIFFGMPSIFDEQWKAMSNFLMWQKLPTGVCEVTGAS